MDVIGLYMSIPSLRLCMYNTAALLVCFSDGDMYPYQAGTDEPKRKPKAKQNQARNGKDKVKGHPSEENTT
ncbi:hypothetical protein Tco_1068153 [Tanacetum coccineum]|uniref:Uncharacterized protein n=1 Tax=Tanacetum coccineum TaxID=301880 RepID=A0ABQ5HF24_9ASTR